MANSLFLADEGATLTFGKSWAHILPKAITLYLAGDLGAGKTTFTRGLLRGMNYLDTVKSPTYSIAESYFLPQNTIHHLDLYRFSNPEEWEDAGLDELFEDNSIRLIEWAQLGGEFVPAADLIFEFSAHNNGRLCIIQPKSALGTWSLDLWHNK